MIEKNFDERFLAAGKGRYIEVDIKTGIKHYIEPINEERTEQWGDVDVVTKKITGTYGDKYIGAIDESESMLTKENGFDVTYNTGVGVSPTSFIESLIENRKD